MNPDNNDQDILNRNNKIQESQNEVDLRTADSNKASVSQYQSQSPAQNHTSDSSVGEDLSMEESNRLAGGDAGYSASNTVSMNDVTPVQSSSSYANPAKDASLNGLGSKPINQNDDTSQVGSDFASLSNQGADTVNDNNISTGSRGVEHSDMGAPKSVGMNPVALVSVILSVAFGIFALIASWIKFDGLSYLALGAGVLSVALGLMVAVKNIGVMRALGVFGAIVGLLGLIVTMYMISVASSDNALSEDVADSETIEAANKDLEQPNEIAEDFNSSSGDPTEFPSLDKISEEDFATAMSFHTIYVLAQDYMSTSSTPPGADQLNSMIESELAKEGVTREQAGFTYSTSIDDLKPGYIVYQPGKSCISENQKDLVDSDGAALLMTATNGAVACNDFKQGS